MAKVSIITPVYADIPQKVDWLKEAIQSVIGQTFTDWEMIIINDNSPHSLDRLKQEYEHDMRLRWLDTPENYGPSMVRNTAMEIAKSDCMLPLDADDMLGSPETIERMFEVWEKDKSKIVFGNLQRLIGDDNSTNFQLEGKAIELAPYSFDENLRLMGVMPITSMHSIKAFDAAGRFKESLKDGLEDLEYWLAAGLGGYCGEKINHTTLIYRRQPKSRTHELKFINQQFERVQAEIRSMYPQVYERGEFPMSCCGGKGGRQAAAAMQSGGSPIGGMITELPEFEEADKLWVLYDGPKQGNTKIMGRSSSLKSDYVVFGTGSHFQIHREDAQFFQGRARLGFKVGVKDPRENKPPPAASPATPQPWISPEKGQLATVIKLDTVANSETTAPAPLPINDVLPESEERDLWDVAPLKMLSDMETVGKFLSILAADNWTPQSLAAAKEDKLTSYPGIGAVTARRIIDEAKLIISS